MAIPSGSGTEVLKRVAFHANNNTWRTLITGVANHIYTILSIVASEQANAAETIAIRIDLDAAGSSQIYLTPSTSLAGQETFVWNDKFVLTGTDKLEIYNSAGDVDWYVTYIDQDWT
jgi:hypothetical protein